MKWFLSCTTSFFLCLGVLFYTVIVMGEYAFDNVHAYGGPTPMALDTAICLAVLSVAGALIATFSARKIIR